MALDYDLDTGYLLRQLLQKGITFFTYLLNGIRYYPLEPSQNQAISQKFYTPPSIWTSRRKKQYNRTVS